MSFDKPVLSVVEGLRASGVSHLIAETAEQLMPGNLRARPE